MTWLWITLPFMIIALGIAIVPVALFSVREERRILSRAYASGELAAPDDRVTRIAAVTKADVHHSRLDEAFAAAHGDSAEALFTGTTVHRSTGEREILVTVPPRAIASRNDLVPRIEEHLRRSDLFDDVRVLTAA